MLHQMKLPIHHLNGMAQNWTVPSATRNTVDAMTGKKLWTKQRKHYKTIANTTKAYVASFWTKMVQQL
jgi:hypothetical protein